MADLDNEWLEALGAEPTDDAPEDDIVEDAPADKDADAEETKDDANNDSDSDNGDGSDNTDDTDGDGLKKDEQGDEQPQEVDSTKQAIKEALQEIDNAKETKANSIQALRQEVAETLYPEGIDRQLRDSDGDPITGIDDLTKLVNPKTGDLFTDEEAGSWLLSAQQKLNKEVEGVEKFIETVAETNANITEGAERVALKYGKVLASDDKLRERLIAAYDKTLVKDPKTKVTINAPVDVMEFFDMALEPRLEAMAKAEDDAAKAAKVKAEQDAKNSQSDRGDLKPSGQSEKLDPETKEWAEAYKQYEQGA